ncbi:MAG: AraC family transcriptional regulator [Bacteroides sp.]|nr:AraC family transcriptional regulator [Bacteroides sp.]
MDTGIHYDITLPENVDSILSSDFWVFEHLTRDMICSVVNPVKFSASVSVYIRKGSALVDINLIPSHISAPCIVNIHKSQILQLKFVSEDFDAAFIVMSKRFTDNLFLLLKDCRVYGTACRQQVASIPEELVDNFEENIRMMKKISSDVSNTYAYQAQVLSISGFFFHTGIKCYLPYAESYPKSNNRIPDQFINLVQQNFKTERFLEFYASKLEITPKHLSRTLKSITGYTAVEWIERYVILEAKVLLKSTNMNIQQIADELNFPSQSFFGKYFKKIVGLSPKEFRNS